MNNRVTIEQIRETMSRLDDTTLLTSLSTMRRMAHLLGNGSTAAVMVVELSREGVKRGILE